MPSILQPTPLPPMPSSVLDHAWNDIIYRCRNITEGREHFMAQDRIDRVHDLCRLVMRHRSVRERSRVRNSLVKQGRLYGQCTYG